MIPKFLRKKETFLQLKKITPKKCFYYSELLIFMIFVLVLDTYAHESGHIYAANKQGINLEMTNINMIPNLKTGAWVGGMSVPKTNNDCLKFNALTLENKQKITRAGVITEFIAFIPVQIVILFMLLTGITTKNRETGWLFCVFLLLMLSSSYYNNVLSNIPGNDWMLTALNCGGA